MLEAIELSRDFGALRAVDSVSFRVEPGQAVGFLGPNGAGKSTTFRMLAGALGPSDGHVRINGHDLAEAPLQAKAQLGYMPENAPLYPEMTVSEYLHFRAELRGLFGGKKKRRAVDVSAGDVQIVDVLRIPIGHLSKGYRQRVALAEALLTQPPVLLLDEPTAGLDPNQVLEVRALIRRLAEKRAVLLSTHVLSEVEASCSRVLLIDRGRLIFDGPLDELRRARQSQQIHVAASREALLEATRDLPGEFRIEEVGPGAPSARILPGDEHFDLTVVLGVLIEKGLTILEAGPERAALDAVFRELTVDRTDSERNAP